MKVVTSGSTYIDIDAYACIVALAELYNLCEEPAVATSSAPFNESITSSLQKLQVDFQPNYIPSSEDTFVLVDVSVPKFFDSIVKLESVSVVIDHHPGYEAYWEERLGSQAIIEKIGAACTQVFEMWEKSGRMGEMSHSSARLLASGILDNTLNFGAKITDKRDRLAYKKLCKLGELSNDWEVQYFDECQEAIESNLVASLEKDLKTDMKNLPPAFGQLVVWDANKILRERFSEIETTMRLQSDEWLLNIISISNDCSYFIATNSKVKKLISVLLGISFKDNIAVAERMWLRKEILAKALSSK